MATESQTRAGFWEERTGWTQLKQLLFLEPLPGGSRWTVAFGSLLLFTLVLQVLTGVLLAMNYAPSVETSYPSVRFIQDEVPLGWFIRALHHWGSSAMVILLLVHLIQVFVAGAYKRPRELTWMVGVLLMFCILSLAFTGYLLPWDQKAYWATRVGLGIASTVPLVGDSLRTLLQGGGEMGNLTLTRFYGIHVFILPGLVFLLIIVHLYLFRLHGLTPTWGQSDEQLCATQEPFWPRQAWKDGVVAMVLLLALGVWCYYRPAPLESQADPSQPYEARPEWYFMFLFQILKYFEGPYEVVGTFVLPTLFCLILFFWPLLDRNPAREPRQRPIALGLLGLATAGLVGLSIFAVVTDVRMHEPTQVVAKQPAPPEPGGTVQWAEVAKEYNATCAACHGVDGSGKLIRAGMPTIPDFTSLAWQMSQTDLEITHRIQDGNEPLMPAYKAKLSERKILGLAVYVRAFAAPSSTPQAPPALPPTAAAMPVEQLYRTYCLACHDGDGRGNTVRKSMPNIPNFSTVWEDAQWRAAHADADCKRAILDGKPPFMLPMKDRMSPADADRLLAFVRGFQGGKKEVKVTPPVVPAPPQEPAVVPEPKATPVAPPSPSVANAERLRRATVLFRDYCLICHGIDGRGTAMRASMPTIPDFTSRVWQDTASNAQVTVSILDGKGTLMPAFRGRVSDSAAQDLMAYVRAFGPVRPQTPEATTTTDFERRFKQLEEEWNELQKQLRQLPQPPAKP
jgi:quinol-cytochrome oxidoreductase complex cytochrome b subunit/mono/diheme cytochrome c family protein